jgi:thymidine kinase
MAYLTLITGPMFADKTTTLIKLAKGHGNNCIVIKPATDDRYGHNFVVSHNGEKYKAVECDPDKLLKMEVENFSHPFDRIYVVIIDEGHFFSNLAESVQRFLIGYNVVVAGIDIDYRRRPFENMQALEPLAKNLIKCRAICKCGKFASFTKMREEHQTESEIVVGGSDKYAPYCGADECLPF